MEFLILGIEKIINFYSILIIAGGVILGIIFGAIPGLTATLGVALLLPFTYNMGPFNGLALLLGIYVGAISGGLISATLIGIPGTPSSILTTLDAYPLAKKGKPREALTIGVFCSFVGGVFSVVVLAVISPLLAQLALKFGPWEYFALGIFGITVVVSVSGKDIIKGFIAGVIGIFISFVGQDPILAIPRFTFGYEQLEGGFAYLPTLLGFFAVTQVFIDLKEIQQTKAIFTLKKERLITPALKVLRKSLVNLFRSSVIGTLIGILPGAGGSTAGFLAYDQAKKWSKTPNKFGTGHFEGIVASEASNNAVTGGAMIPMMTLGIPGDVVTAVLLGGLMIHGLRPGPLLFKNNPEVVGSIFIAMLVANVFMLFIEMGLLGFFARIIQIQIHILLPTILLMIMVGAFGVNNRVFDIYLVLIFGIMGYILKENDFPLPPLILGFILGPIIEENYRLGMMTTGGDISMFFIRPISVFFLILSSISIFYPIIISKFKKDQ